MFLKITKKSINREGIKNTLRDKSESIKPHKKKFHLFFSTYSLEFLRLFRELTNR